VDLERRRVVDLLADRSVETTAGWLKSHPEVEVVRRDRAGLYAKLRVKARHRQGRSLTAFILCRTSASPLNGSLASLRR
jgi:transposase